MSTQFNSMPEGERESFLREQSAWAGQMWDLLSSLNKRFEQRGDLNPWGDLWRQIIALSHVSAVVDISSARIFQSRISTLLHEIDAYPEERQISEFRFAIGDVLPALVTEYAEAGAADQIEGLAADHRTAEFIERLNLQLSRRIETTAADIRAEMAELARADERAAKVLTQADDAARKAQESAARAEASATAAGVAAGKAGTNALADEFEKFAKDHKTASRNYRFWTITVLTAAVIIAALFVLGLDRLLLAWIGAPASALSESLDSGAVAAAAEGQRWQAVVYRLAILGGLAGLSAYLGRQASQHRRLHDWGRSVEAQARSFEAFAEQIEDPETKKQVQLLFSNRVLGSPPEPTAEKTITRDALQIVADATMKSRGTT